MIISIVEGFVFGVGAAVCAAGATVLVAWLWWHTIEFVCRRAGWTKQLIEAYRRILQERRTSWPAH